MDTAQTAIAYALTYEFTFKVKNTRKGYKIVIWDSSGMKAKISIHANEVILRYGSFSHSVEPERLEAQLKELVW